jgi:hypothetical protein
MLDIKKYFLLFLLMLLFIVFLDVSITRTYYKGLMYFQITKTKNSILKDFNNTDCNLFEKSQDEDLRNKCQFLCNQAEILSNKRYKFKIENK